MKKLFPLLLLLTVMISCIKKEEVTADEKKQESVSSSVGNEIQGKYVFKDADSLVYKWNVFVNKKMKPQDSIILDDFSIVKTKTQGESVQDCYLLIAKSKIQKVALGTILEQKEGKFYTAAKDMSGFNAYEVILCNGACGDTICNPDVLIAKGVKRLICSTCDQCIKISGSID